MKFSSSISVEITLEKLALQGTPVSKVEVLHYSEAQQHDLFYGKSRAKSMFPPLQILGFQIGPEDGLPSVDFEALV
ncbi:hypothetical protein P5673_027613 [Acropora cervicornis]|uniref:Uncharacterized protein n=1 Tax=Acropora cervicornis TaxID=6130 RepID=A0AAD9PYI7_ACRCE|nr:hypothetical protein P5673_027613 [Acropora cervicornis]